ncbi:MAG: hypothetical protein ABI680_07805, partial [Chthoniobacteraceae bacterium]
AAQIAARNVDPTLFLVKEDPFDDPAQAQAVGGVALDLFARRDFASIDYFADRARAEKMRLSNGDWVESKFCRALYGPAGNSPNADSWKKHGGRIIEWERAVPDSIIAPVIDAQFAIKRAWQARGRGFANTVKPEQWALFARHIAEARQTLEGAPRKSPEWYDAMLTVALAESLERPARDAIFAEGWKAFPGYGPLVNAHAYSLLPRWLGEPGDWGKFTEDFATRNGAEYYPGPTLDRMRIELAAVKEAVDLPLFCQGFEKLIADHPDAISLRHRYARALWQLNAETQLPAALRNLGDTYHVGTWASAAELDFLRQRYSTPPKK